MREPRLGDIIDDYCVKCKRIMNHAVVSLLNGEPAKVRCRTCHNDHDYRHEQPPPPKVDNRKQALFNEVLAKVAPGSSAAAVAPAPFLEDSAEEVLLEEEPVEESSAEEGPPEEAPPIPEAKPKAKPKPMAKPTAKLTKPKAILKVAPKTKIKAKAKPKPKATPKAKASAPSKGTAKGKAKAKGRK
jgi:hypothetical protein